MQNISGMKMLIATESEFNELLDSIGDFWMSIDGLPQPTYAGRQQFVTDLARYLLIQRPRASLDKLVEGLNHCSVLDFIKQNGLHGLLIQDTDTKVTAEYVTKLLVPKYGRAEHVKEQEVRTYGFFVQLLSAMEDGNLADHVSEDCPPAIEEFAKKVDVSAVLIFVTGADKTPPGGFGVVPSIAYIHEDKDIKRMPSASTCACVLNLIVTNNNMETFVERFLEALMNGICFTKI